MVKDRRGRLIGTLAGRYPEAAWGQLNLNFCIPYVLGKGREGPVATVRSEAFREGIQELEANFRGCGWKSDSSPKLRISRSLCFVLPTSWRSNAY